MHFRDIGLNIAKGITSWGKSIVFKKGEIIFTRKSIRPEFLSKLIATKSPINVGKILNVICIPSLAPFKKMSKTLYTSFGK